jgi:hypothetical protein
MRRSVSGVVVLLAVATAVAAWLAASSGAASSGDLTLTPAPAQPTDATGLQLHASGSASVPATIQVVYRQSGTGACGGPPGTSTGDPGAAFPPNGTQVPAGQFPDVTVPPPQNLPIGSYIICGYLVDSSDSTNVLATTSLTVAVGAADTVEIDPPSDAVQGRPFDIGAHGVLYDGSANIDATYKRAGGACATSPAADTGTVTRSSGASPGTGAYSVIVAPRVTLDPGDWLVCAWIVDPNVSASPLASSPGVVVHVRALSTSLALRAPGRVDAGQPFSASTVATVEHDIPVEAVVKEKPLRAGASCAASPTSEPTGDVVVLDQGLADTQQPSGSVSADPAPVSLAHPGRYLLCGWLLGAWPAVSEQASVPVVAGPVSAVVAASGPQTFRGRTSQHHGFKLVLARVQQRVLEIAYTDHIHCRGLALLPSGLPWNGTWNNDLTTNNFGTLQVSRTGRIHTSLMGNPNLGLVLTARKRGRHITGAFTEIGRSFAFTGNTAQNLACTSGRVRFSLRGP